MTEHLKKIASMIDKVSDTLEQKGLVDEAKGLDVIANSIEDLKNIPAGYMKVNSILDPSKIDTAEKVVSNYIPKGEYIINENGLFLKKKNWSAEKDLTPMYKELDKLGIIKRL